MSKKCAKCTKTVYTTEELKCLDKIWHKACFKCQVCGMTLNMKNYKGYDKLPYCNAHYPTTKHTQVADTPESRRIAENTKIQSQIQYHEDFEKSKGKVTQVADTVEMQRHTENTKNFSLLNYHRAYEKGKDKFTAVADPVLLKNQMQASKAFSLLDYHKDFEKNKAKYTAVADPVLVKSQMEATKKVSLKEYHNDYEHSKWKYTPVADSADMQHHVQNKKIASMVEYKKDFERTKSKYTPVPDTVEMQRHHQNKKNREGPRAQQRDRKSRASVQYHADFEKQKGHKTSVAEDPEMARIKQNTAIQSNINYWGVREQRSAMEEKRPQETVDEVAGRRRNPGKISDYDPGVPQFNSPYSGKTQANIVYDSHSGEGRRSYTEDRRSYTDDRRSYTDEQSDRRSYTDDRRSYTDDRKSYTDDQRSYTEDRRSYTDEFSNPGRRQPGSISDYDPLNQNFGSIVSDPRQAGYKSHPEPVHQPAPPAQPAYQPAPPQPQSQKSKGMMCRAMYDYSAADSDEVSFADGDIIIECQPVDAGWMVGRVERTGQYGMLPSNYVERIN